MKNILLLYISILFCLQGFTQSDNPAKDTSVSFTVSGVCAQCKRRIESALKVKGVESANWSIDSKVLALSYNPARITLDEIQNKIIGVGHDIEGKKADDAVYKDLP